MPQYDRPQGQTGPYGAAPQQEQPRRAVADSNTFVQQPYSQRRQPTQYEAYHDVSYDEPEYAGQSYPPMDNGYSQPPVQPSQPYQPIDGQWQPSQPYPPMDNGYNQPPVQPSQPYQPIDGQWQQSQPYPSMDNGYNQPPVQPGQPYPPYTGGQPVQAPEGWPDTGAQQPQNPFDETGYDPSLKDLRATHLYSHKDPFWDDFEEQKKKKRKQEKQLQKEQKRQAKAQARAAAAKARAGSHAGRKTLAGCAIAAAVVLLLGSQLLRVREIQVQGQHYTYSPAMIAQAAGISLGQSMIDIDEEDVAARINSNRYLVFRSMEKKLLNTVILNVKERVPAAVLMYSGTNYLIDHRGMVLEETPTQSMMADLPVVSGIQVKGNYGCLVGSYLKIASTAQFDTLCQLLLELRVQSAQYDVKSINLSNLDNILMEMDDGYAVCLGDQTYLHGKIKAMLFVRDELIARGSGRGTIDVSNRQKPTFIPD